MAIEKEQRAAPIATGNDGKEPLLVFNHGLVANKKRTKTHSLVVTVY